MKKTLALFFVFAVLIQSARADLFTINGQVYDITAQNLSWDTDSALLIANPWYGLSYNDALAFSTAVGFSLGAQQPGSQLAPQWGPLFVYNSSLHSSGNTGFGYQPTSFNGYQSYTFTYAVGHAVSAPDGGSTVALLSAAVLGFAVLRRKRSTA